MHDKNVTDFLNLMTELCLLNLSKTLQYLQVSVNYATNCTITKLV